MNLWYITDRQSVYKGENTMRVVKDAEERRSEILDAADRLFGEKGFDGTSTNDIWTPSASPGNALLPLRVEGRDHGRPHRPVFGAPVPGGAGSGWKPSVPIVERIIRVIQR
jgi:hypothetical protein